METAAIFCCFAHVSKRLPLKKSPLFCHSVGPRFNAAQVEFGPTAMPFLPIGNDISFNPFRQLTCGRKHSMMPRHFPKFLMWKLQGIPERGIGISALRRSLIVLGTFLDQVIEAKRVPSSEFPHVLPRRFDPPEEQNGHGRHENANGCGKPMTHNSTFMGIYGYPPMLPRK